MALKTYSPNDVKINAGGVPIDSGLADGTFVNISAMGDGTTSQSGADGETARAISLDNRYQVTLTLQQTSIHNTTLMGLYEADQVSDGRAAFPFAITDLRGQTLLAGTGWITNPADAGYSEGVENREWTIEVDGAFFSGGTA